MCGDAHLAVLLNDVFAGLGFAHKVAGRLAESLASNVAATERLHRSKSGCVRAFSWQNRLGNL